MLRPKAQKICKRAAYLLRKNSARSSKVIHHRKLIARCY